MGTADVWVKIQEDVKITMAIMFIYTKDNIKNPNKEVESIQDW